MSALQLHVVKRLERCASTQDEAAKLLAQGAATGAVVVAAEQSAGRGRSGRSFLSAKGGVYLSVILRPQMPPQRLPRLTLFAGAALLDLCERLGIRAASKWPNDLLLPATTPGALGLWRKAAGVLVEAQTDPDGQVSVLLGVGLNVVPPAEGYPSELRTIAIALGDVSPSLSVAQVEAGLLSALQARLTDAEQEGGFERCLATLRRKSAYLGQRVHLREEDISGVAEALDDNGALIVRDGQGVAHRVFAGDVLPHL